MRYAAVAQLDRVPDSDSGGRGFESRQPYLKNRLPLRKPVFYCQSPKLMRFYLILQGRHDILLLLCKSEVKAS